jgi:hypothetical protein
MKKRLILYFFLLLLSFDLLAQFTSRLSLDKPILFPREALSFSYVSIEEERDSPTFFLLLNIRTGTIEDFIFSTEGDKFVRHEIALKPHIAADHYALMAYNPISFELHYEQFWVLDPSWQRMVRNIQTDEYRQSLQVNFRTPPAHFEAILWKEDIALEQYAFSASDIDEDQIRLEKVHAEREDIWLEMVLKDAEQKEMARHWHLLKALQDHTIDNADDLPFKIEKGSITLNTKGYHHLRVIAMGREFMDMEIADDSLVFQRSQLPIGDLLFELQASSQEATLLELYNPPFVPAPSRAIRARAGEYIELESPTILHPWQHNEGLYVQAMLEPLDRQLSVDHIHRGSLYLNDTLGRDHDAFIIRIEGLKKAYKGLNILYTDGEGVLDLETDENGEVRMSYAMIEMLGKREGRARLRDADRKAKLKIEYPSVSWIEGHLARVLKGIAWKGSPLDQLVDNVQPEMDFVEDWTIELEELTVMGESGQALIQEVLDDPFSVHWLNTDYYSTCWALNCGFHPPSVGNIAGASFRIPLHIFLEARTGVQKMMAEMSGFPLPPYSGHGVRRTMNYKWDPDWYADAISMVRLPHTNKLQDTLDVSVPLSNDALIPYRSNTKLKLRAPLMPGEYTLRLKVYNLYHNLSTTVSYEVLVRN